MSAKETKSLYRKNKRQRRKRPISLDGPIEIDETLKITIPPDQIKQVTDALSAVLLPTLISSSPSAEKRLHDAAEAFLRLFAKTSQESLDQLGTSRLAYALTEAAGRIRPGSLRVFFTARVKMAAASAVESLREEPSKAGVIDIATARKRLGEQITPAEAAAKIRASGNTAS